MKANDRELTGYCGLFCGDCIRFNSRASELSAQLLEELKTIRFHEYSKIKRQYVKALENYESAVDTLRAISSINCTVPCSLGGDGCSGSCHIIKCIKDKAINGCWECAVFETCSSLDFLKEFHGDTPIKNLSKIKELGLDSWASYREKNYPWD